MNATNLSGNLGNWQMINDVIVRHAYELLEREIRHGDEAIAAASTPAIRRREQKRRNAINSACNALHRYTRA